MKKKQTLGSVDVGSRGFEVIRFKDLYDTPCSLQVSSIAIYEKPGTSAIWIGCDDAKPMVLASQAAIHGVKTNKTTGWVPYPLSDEVSLSTRAHLGREQVEALIEHLKSWLENDTLEIGGDK